MAKHRRSLSKNIRGSETLPGTCYVPTGCQKLAFRTGDLGVIGKSGYLRLVGRIKEMIRVGGENVTAADVESVLLKHDAIKQGVAVGIADPRLTEVVAVFIEIKTGKHTTEEEIIDFCRRHLASFKVPRRVKFVYDWPMTGAGKIQRYPLKESLGQTGPEA